MKNNILRSALFCLLLCPALSSCGPADLLQEDLGTEVQVIFLHHSTGGVIWNGGVPEWFTDYNAAQQKNYQVTERAYPSGSPYPWDNYPYDYWNIWVEHAGSSQYLSEDTLELLTPVYDVIIWKHCYPVANLATGGTPDITSSSKTLTNYCLQYQALKSKMRNYPQNRFLVWTGAANVEANSSESEAQTARTFFNWVKNTWDEPGDNIFVFDFWQLETEGGIYLRPEYAENAGDSHPNAVFAQTIAPLFCSRIVSVIQGTGDLTSLTGE